MIHQFTNRAVTFASLCLLVTFAPACSTHKITQSTPIIYDTKAHPVIILGGGIGGLTAALYCSQANIPCLVIEGQKPGGALSQSHSVRNWPGVIDAPGADIVSALKKQVANAGVTIVQEKVTSVDLTHRPFTITTSATAQSDQVVTRATNSCIIAMGTEPNFLNIPGEREADGYWGRGITNCAVCEGSLCKGKKVAVVGGGDAAMVEAGYLADIADHVTIFVRGKKLRAKDEKTKQLTLGKPNVAIVYATQVTAAKGNGKHLTHLVIKNTATGTETTEVFDALFLAIGSRPNTALFKEQLELDTQGFIVLKDHQEASIPGVFAAGDVCDHFFVQAITAAGQGCMAALQSKKYLEGIGFATSMVSQLKSTEQSEPKKPITKQEKSTSPNDDVIEITSNQDFEKIVLAAKVPVVIDLFSTWCIPCQNMMPIVHALAKEFAGKVAFVKINVSKRTIDLNACLTQIKGVGITSVPTFLFVTKGKEVKRVVGAIDMSEFRQSIKRYCVK